MFNRTDDSARARSFLGGDLLAAAVIVTAVFGIVLLSKVSLAAPFDAKAAAESRKAHFKELEEALRTIRKELSKPNPDLASVRDRSKLVGALSSQLPTWFPAGTGPDLGFDTKAEASIWQQPLEFRRAAQDFADQAALLVATSMQGDIPAIRERLHAVGGSCQSCHGRFRNDSWW